MGIYDSAVVGVHVHALTLVMIECPFTNCSRVEHSLGGREGLADHDHKSRFRVQAFQGSPHVHRIDVGEESRHSLAAKVRVVTVVGPNGFEDEFGPEVTAANSDTNDIGEKLP